jgi:hypothetical protein
LVFTIFTFFFGGGGYDSKEELLNAQVTRCSALRCGARSFFSPLHGFGTSPQADIYSVLIDGFVCLSYLT